MHYYIDTTHPLPTDRCIHMMPVADAHTLIDTPPPSVALPMTTIECQTCTSPLSAARK